MRWPFAGRKLRRTCFECGTSWVVPRAAARVHGPSKWRRGILPMDAPGGPLFDAGLAEQVEAMHQRQEGEEGTEREIQYFASLNRCPNCGSQRYKQERA